MRRIVLVILCIAIVLPPLVAEETSYSFSCEDLQVMGKSMAPRFPSYWMGKGLVFGAGFALAGVFAWGGFLYDGEHERLFSSSQKVGGVAAAGAAATLLGMVFSSVAPFFLFPSESLPRHFDSIEQERCFRDGYLPRARRTNAFSSLLGSSIGGAGTTLLLWLLAVALSEMNF